MVFLNKLRNWTWNLNPFHSNPFPQNGRTLNVFVRMACLKPRRSAAKLEVPWPLTRVRPRRRPRAKNPCFCRIYLSRGMSRDLGRAPSRALQFGRRGCCFLRRPSLSFQFICFFKGHALLPCFISTKPTSHNIVLKKKHLHFSSSSLSQSRAKKNSIAFLFTIVKLVTSQV